MTEARLNEIRARVADRDRLLLQSALTEEGRERWYQVHKELADAIPLLLAEVERLQEAQRWRSVNVQPPPNGAEVLMRCPDEVPAVAEICHVRSGPPRWADDEGRTWEMRETDEWRPL